ncbi:RidA family protein [Actinocorallia aurea]
MKPPFPPAVLAGGVLWLSGHVAQHPDGTFNTGSFEEQTDAVFAALTRTLDAHGMGLHDLVRVECFLTDPADFPAWNAAFAAAFPDDPPARTTLVTALALPGLRIEIQAVAVPSRER